MLVLARSHGQSVVLDDRITVTVLASRSGLVRLGIEAPDGVGVRRGELGLLPEARRPRRRPEPTPASSPGPGRAPSASPGRVPDSAPGPEPASA